MINDSEFTYSEWQQGWIEARTPKAPKELTSLQNEYFDRAVKKIRFIPTAEGGLNTDFSRLIREELFAIGELGTPTWPIMIPDGVRQKGEILKRKIQSGGTVHLFPVDPIDMQQFLELERRTIVGFASDKVSEELAVALSRRASRKKGTAKLKKNGEETRSSIQVTAFEICSKNLLRNIKKDTVASEIFEKLKKPRRERILKLLSEIYPGDQWPPVYLEE